MDVLFCVGKGGLLLLPLEVEVSGKLLEPVPVPVELILLLLPAGKGGLLEVLDRIEEIEPVWPTTAPIKARRATAEAIVQVRRQWIKRK